MFLLRNKKCSRITLLFGVFLSICSGSGSHSHNVPYADESFRRLQSGENSEEIVNQCCRRETKFVTAGYGVEDSQLQVDVGECREVCERPPIKPLKRDEFDRYLKKYPNMDPVQIFLALQSRVTPNDNNSTIPSPSLSLEQDQDQEEDLIVPSSSIAPFSISMSTSSSSCLSSTCHPTSIRKERHFGLGGQHYLLDVIESCDCLKIPDTCQKLSKPVKFHVDTPYETVVDLGQCLGSCGDSSSGNYGVRCRPVRNRTVSVEGPNGFQCTEVIGECECTGNCFRIKEFFKVYDYSTAFPNLSENSTTTTTTTTTEIPVDPLDENRIGFNSLQFQDPMVPIPPIQPLTKVIDIGRCGGSCSPLIHHQHQHHHNHVRVTSKCLLWSESGTCVSSLYGGQTMCYPTKFMTHSYIDKKGQRHKVLSVLNCGCQ